MILEQATRHNRGEMAKSFETKMENMNATVQNVHEGQVEVKNTAQILHERQISMDTNIIILMRKMGITIEGAPVTTIERKTKHAGTTSTTEDSETITMCYTNSQYSLPQSILTQEEDNIVMKVAEE